MLHNTTISEVQFDVDIGKIVLAELAGTHVILFISVLRGLKGGKSEKQLGPEPTLYEGILSLLNSYQRDLIKAKLPPMKVTVVLGGGGGADYPIKRQLTFEEMHTALDDFLVDIDLFLEHFEKEFKPADTTIYATQREHTKEALLNILKTMTHPLDETQFIEQIQSPCQALASAAGHSLTTSAETLGPLLKQAKRTLCLEDLSIHMKKKFALFARQDEENYQQAAEAYLTKLKEEIPGFKETFILDYATGGWEKFCGGFSDYEEHRAKEKTLYEEDFVTKNEVDEMCEGFISRGDKLNKRILDFGKLFFTARPDFKSIDTVELIKIGVIDFVISERPPLKLAKNKTLYLYSQKDIKDEFPSVFEQNKNISSRPVNYHRIDLTKEKVKQAKRVRTVPITIKATGTPEMTERKLPATRSPSFTQPKEEEEELIFKLELDEPKTPILASPLPVHGSTTKKLNAHFTHDKKPERPAAPMKPKKSTEQLEPPRSPTSQLVWGLLAKLSTSPPTAEKNKKMQEVLKVLMNPTTTDLEVLQQQQSVTAKELPARMIK